MVILTDFGQIWSKWPNWSFLTFVKFGQFDVKIGDFGFRPKSDLKVRFWPARAKYLVRDVV